MGRARSNDCSRMSGLCRLTKPMPRILLAALCLLASVAHAAGNQLLHVPASGGRPALNGMIWYPCADVGDAAPAAGSAQVGANHCAMHGDALPLIVISH